MRLGIMQPYFFPYLGYFELIAKTDRWVVYDTAQDIKHGWVNRNRILHPTKGWQYITVPRKKHPLGMLIQDVKIADREWRTRILGQLDHYRKTAPFYDACSSLVRASFETSTDSLSKLNVECLIQICQYIGIPFSFKYASDLEVNADVCSDACDKVLNICEQMGASEYRNPAGGRSLYDESRFRNRGMGLSIQEYAPYRYECPGYDYEPSLSILDVLMWVSPTEVRDHLIR